jgi:hypothetical protein
MSGHALSSRTRAAVLEDTRPVLSECAQPIDETRLALARCGWCQQWCAREHDRCRRCRRGW